MIPKRVDEMTSFIVMDVLEEAQRMERAGIDVIHLEVGEPDFEVPECVSAAICRAVKDGHTHYTHSLGMIELREAISASIQINQIATAAEEQTATTGQISDNIQQITRLVQDTADGFHSCAAQADQLTACAQDLEHIVNKFKVA